MNFYQLMLPLTSIFSLKIPFSLLTLSLIIRGPPLLGNNEITLTFIVYNRQVKIIDN